MFACLNLLGRFRFAEAGAAMPQPPLDETGLVAALAAVTLSVVTVVTALYLKRR